MQASGSCSLQQLKHTFIPNASAKQETAASKLKHELLYYLSTSSITGCPFGGNVNKTDLQFNII